MEKVFLNDNLVDADKAGIPVNDAGFLYGAGLFETMRASNGVVFSLEDHLERLFSSAHTLSIDNSYDKKFITESAYKVLEANKLSDARLRLTLSSGPMAADGKEHKSTLLITATKFTPYPAEYYKNGVMVIISSFKQNLFDPTFGHKTINYFPRIMALEQARSKGAAEALWFTTDNRLAEGCVSNVFLVKDSVLYTPPLTTPVLAGVARKTVCKLAENNSIELSEKDLSINDVLEADEIFITNVVMQIMPVVGVEKHTVGDGKVGSVTKKLMKYFDGFIKKNCGKGK
jgi:branched-chain amino acid aminotransferase